MKLSNSEEEELITAKDLEFNRERALVDAIDKISGHHKKIVKKAARDGYAIVKAREKIVPNTYYDYCVAGLEPYVLVRLNQKKSVFTVDCTHLYITKKKIPIEFLEFVKYNFDIRSELLRDNYLIIENITEEDAQILLEEFVKFQK